MHSSNGEYLNTWEQRVAEISAAVAELGSEFSQQLESGSEVKITSKAWLHYHVSLSMSVGL